MKFTSSSVGRLLRRITLAWAFLVIAMTGEGQQPVHGTLSNEDYARLGSAVQFDINLVRLYPQALDNQEFMRYFAALNNCQHPEILHTIDNEIDFSRVAAYYRDHASEIAGGLPPLVGVALYGGKRSIHDDRFVDTAALGEYDAQRAAFPLVTHAAWGTAQQGPAANTNTPSSAPGSTTVTLGSLFHRKKDTADGSGDTNNANGAAASGHHEIQLNGEFEIESVRDALLNTCSAANSIAHQSGGQFGLLPHNYAVRTDTVGFDELPMPEDAARRYIDGHPPAMRGVELEIFVRILDQQPAVENIQGAASRGINRATFNGKVAKVLVIDTQTGAALGVLMDDHTVPDFMDTAAASQPPQPAPSQGPESAVFMSHLTPPVEGPRQFHYNALKQQHANYLQSIDVAVQVRMANDLCKWHLAGDQLHNVDALLRDAQNDPSGSKELAYKAGFIQRGIDSFGPDNYCRNYQMRSQYEQFLQLLWPDGNLANPDAFW